MIDAECRSTDSIKFINRSLESDEVDTMAGAIIEKLGYFPDDDEVVKGEI